MRDHKHTYKVRARLLLMVVAVLLLAACSNDDTPEIGGETDILQLVAYNQLRTDVSETTTRAITYPSDYSEYQGPNSIGVYAMPIPTTAYPNPEYPTEVRTFSYDTKNQKWKSLVSVKNDETYRIYGYMPVNSNIHCSIKRLPGETTYEAGAVMTFTDLPPVLGGDFSVVTGLLQLNLDNEGNVIENGSLAEGNFSYTGKQNGKNFVCLMLDHLYSCVRFNFLVDANYSKLRTIKLTKVELKSESHYTYPLTVTFRQKPETVPTDYKPYTIEWGDQDVLTSSYATLFTSEEGELLPMSNMVDGYFAPFSDISNNLVIKCTYDVYDKEENKIREMCTAENKLPANRLTTGFNQRTTLTLTVKPTYLYVLSDPDVDNPTFEVN